MTESDQDRTEFAARLTICEMEAHQLMIPKECQDWIKDLDGDGGGGGPACLSAIHQSPQSWSSYSGHLREAVVLCFGYHHLQEFGQCLKIPRLKKKDQRIGSETDHETDP